MLCDICGKSEANVHITRIVNGAKQELNVCDKCAKEMGDFNINNMGEDFDFSSPFSFQNILSGLMDYINHASNSQISYDPVCKSCGMKFSEFRKSGLLGCSECYNNFSSTLMSVIKRVQSNTEHTGKIPQKLGKDIIEKRRIIELKEQLQKAIASEEYEKAAEIRDMIKGIQKDESK